MKKLKITQSMLKSFVDYKNGKECGLVFKAKFFYNVEFTPTETQNIGCWFEFKLTGALPKNGKEPVPKYLADKVTLADKYRKMSAHIPNFKLMIDHYGLEIISFGEKISIDDAEGTIDLRVKATRDIHIGNEFIAAGSFGIVDIKTTGLIDDKWSDFGWNTERLSEKEGLMIQPVMYKYLAKEKYGVDHFFFFMIFSNTNEYDEKLILMDIDALKVQEMSETIRKAKLAISKEEEKGFEAYPSIQNCKECPLKDTCQYFTKIPIAEVVSY